MFASSKASAQMDFDKARHMMRQRQLDALLLCSPGNFYYGTGCSSMLVQLYRRAALSMALIPADAAVEPAILLPATDAERAHRESGIQDVYGIPVWFKHLTAPGRAAEVLAGAPEVLPEQYDRTETCRQLALRLRERGLAHSRVGADLDFVDVNTFALIQQASPQVEFVDATALLYDLRSVKNPTEIAALRAASQLTAAGITAAGKRISRTSTVASVTQAFVAGVWAAARRGGIEAHLGPIEGQSGFGYPGPAPAVSGELPEGTTVKFDVQASVAHYYADLGRTYVVGQATAEQARCWQVLVAAHERARAALRPGVPINAVFAAAQETLARAGLGGYPRGHIGHSVGLDPNIEEPPFISATCTRLLEPGMVLALEVPFTVRGIGAFQLEDMCLITEEGYEVLNDLPYDLQVVEA